MIIGAKCVLSSRALNALKGVRSIRSRRTARVVLFKSHRTRVRNMYGREADRWAYVRYHVPGEAK